MKKNIYAFLFLILVISSCKLKEDTTGPDTDKPGAISTTIKVLTPNGNEVLSEGSSYQITWSGTGTSHVKIQYSVDNGTSWSLIVDSLKNTGVYSWFPIPNTISNQCRVQVTSVDGKSTDASDNVFSIIRNSNQSLKISSPKEKEEWEGGSAKQIKWFSSGIDSVKIEYTTNNGIRWNLVAVDKKNTGIYYWEPVPNTPSTLARVRIMDAKDGEPSSESELFNILPEPKIKVLAPNGGERIISNTSRKIEWISENIENVKLAYTTNNGFNWVVIKESVPSTGFYTWDPVPNANSQLCKIRVFDAKDGEPSDVSDSTFTITNQITQTLEVTSPNGNERWQAGTNQQITWRSSGIAKVKIDFTSNNGLTWNTIIDKLANTGAYEWNVPNSFSTQCLIRITDADDGDPVDQSNGLFRIVPKPELAVLSPNGGETWTAGKTDTIKWKSTGVENVTIEYTPNNGINWFTIIEKTPSSGSYVTSFSTAGTQFKIRITDKENGSPQDESDGTFTVTPEPKIVVLEPNGKEEWYSGSSNNIKWTSTNIENVKIEYTTNNGASWSVIISSTPSTGVYAWKNIPSNISSLQCRIRVSDAIDGIPSDVSDENFSILTYGVQLIKVTKPNGGESWVAGSTQVITWDAAGIQNVKIEYTLNNGIQWNVITNSTPSTGYFTWAQIPTTSSTNCKIRISDAADNSPSDESDQFFTIEPEPIIKVITPKGGEVWTSGTTQEIRWESQNVANVKIEYTTDAGANWNTIIGSTPSIGYFVWKSIPNINSLQCRIRISDAADGNPFAVSENNFQISNQVTQSIRVTSPNGGENWRERQSQAIKWDSQGITSVNIEFTTNNGNTWTSIVTNHLSSGSYQWQIPAGINSIQCKVRVSDAADNDPSDESNSSFSIQLTPEITKINFPTNGANIIAGEQINIQWVSKGIRKVRIRYNRNDLTQTADWFTLVDSVDNSGSFPTTFKHDPLATTYVVEISATDGSASLLSGSFKVLPPPSVTLIAPNGGEQWLVSKRDAAPTDLINYHPYEIKWKATNAEKVKIEWSTNGGGKWYTVPDAESTENDGSFIWAPGRIVKDFDTNGNPIVPDSSDNCLIRISSSGGASDMSNDVFSIHKSKKIRIKYPNSGEDFYPPEDLTNPKASKNWPMLIDWTSYAVTSVNIYYSLDNGVTWKALATNYQSTGAFAWDFVFGALAESRISTQGLIKIEDAALESPTLPPGKRIWDVNDVPFWLNIKKTSGKVIPLENQIKSSIKK
ncbi:MAG: hypothetical protein FD143_2477 [Ignavibacteria bacterium]|nr:MAG: hypothetical protein FD143_2477 [Ignavibacteria bacterium]KAF0157284.1 MAG: hypothetical protein FD188_2802 [Ignavibacteria bacterium]